MISSKYTATIAACAALIIARCALGQPPPDPVALGFAQTRGVEIYLRDQAAWFATDAVGVDALVASGVVGWVTAPIADQWLVRFIGECGEQYCVPFDVAVDLETDESRVTEHDSPESLTVDELATWKARQVALESGFAACSQRYNTVVIPNGTQDERRWVVYLLAATDQPNLVVVGGHHRVTVSADGSTILESEPLSSACLAIKTNEQTSAIVVSHVLDPYPIETHVFTSLNYGLPVFVQTSAGNFEVEGSDIHVLDQSSPGGTRNEP